jgi:hypothetical protein
VKGLELTVMRTVNFSRISSWTWILESSFWKTWGWFAAKWRVTLAVKIWPGALTPDATVLGGDVGGGLLPCSRSPNLSSTVHGFSILTTLSRRLCSSHTTSCSAHLLAVSKESIALVCNDHGLGPVLQRGDARIHGGLLWENRRS